MKAEDLERLTKEVCLGDGLYASFDGWQVKLRAARECGDHEIYLDPTILGHFIAYVERLEEELVK